MKFRELKLRRDPACRICGDNPTIKELIDYDQFCGIQPAPAEPVGNPDEVTVQDMKQALDNAALGIKLIDVREADEYEIAKVVGVPLLLVETAQRALHGTRSEPAVLSALQAGGRSLKALNFPRQQGFKYLKSVEVEGGITAWSEEIDSKVTRY